MDCLKKWAVRFVIPDDFFQMRLLFQEVDIAILQNLYIQVMEKEKDELI